MTVWQKLVPVLVVLTLIGLGSGGYFFYKYQKTNQEIQTIKTDPSSVQKAVQEQVKQLVAEVGRLIDLPSGEEPTVATITDLEKLKDQPFFRNAKNGDKVIIYTQAKKAILYDPIAHRIIDVAPINIGSQSAQQAIKVVLRNGTTTSGLTNKIEPEVKKAMSQVNIVTKENADKNDYEKSIVVVVNENYKDAANTIAKGMNISVGELPSGENKPKDVDILIILGKDKI